MSAQHKVRWGIIAAGGIAGKVAPSIAAGEGGELVAIASRNLDKAQAFAKDKKIPRAYGAYEALLADREVDAVYITTPNSRHHDDVLAAARAGKHILCEKPMAATAREVESMFDATSRAGVVMMEAFMYRCHPLAQTILKTVRDGAIGRVQMIHSTFGFRLGQGHEDNIRLRRELQGGGLMDVGCYCLNFARALAGAEPDRLAASAQIGASGVDEWMSASLGFPNGATATIICAVQCQTGAVTQVWGDQGMLEVNNPWWGGEPEARFQLKRVGEKQAQPVVVAADRKHYQYQIEAMNAAILRGAALPLTREDAVGNARAIEALRRAVGLS